MGRANSLLLVCVAILCGVLCAGPAQAQADRFNISLLYTGDTHGHLKSFPYGGSKAVGGVAKRAIFFQDKRRHKGMTWLTLDAGDAISGTALSNIFKGALDIESMNRLGYDAMAIGVHEFDYGQDVLKQRISEAKFSVLSANVVYEDSGQPFATPYVILERGGIKIAILGLTTGELKQRVAPEHFTGLRVVDPIETARQIVPQLRSQCQMVVALTHLGVNEDIRLASQVQGIDVIVGGMSHSELQVPMKVGETLIVHDALFGANVGLLKLSFAKDINGGFKRVYFDCQLEPMEGKWVENSNYLEWLASYSTQLNEKMNLIVGSASNAMTNLKTRSSETELGNYFCDLIRQKSGADAAILPAAFFQAGLPSGALTLGDLYRVIPYDHYAVVLPVTGGELKEILDDAAAQIGKPGFPQVSGLKFGIYNGRAYQIEVNGSPLDPFATYRVVTSDFLADGGLGYATMGTVDDRVYTGRLIRDLVVEQLGGGQSASSGVYGRIFFLAQEPAQSGGGQPTQPTQPAQPLDDEPGEMPTESGGNLDDDMERLDRNGEPLEDDLVEDDPLVIEDELVTGSDDLGDTVDEAVDEVTDDGFIEDEMDSAVEDAIDTADSGLDEVMSSVSDVAGSDDLPQGNIVGRAQQSVDGIDYTFTVVEVSPDRYVFHLQLYNSSSLPVELSYATGERFNFLVFDGNGLKWDYNFNRFHVQTQETSTLGPGSTMNYRVQPDHEWDGTDKEGKALPAQAYRFEARHISTSNPANLSFEAALGN